MQLVILSDTHGRTNKFLRIVETYQKTADAFLFTGDGMGDANAAQKEFPDAKIYTVKGNNDFGNEAPLQRRIDFTIVEENPKTITVFMEHGDSLPYSHREDAMFSLTRRQKAQIGLFGHTHVPFAQMENDILILNPGSTSYPRGGSKPSYAIITIDNDGSFHWSHYCVDDLFTDEEKEEKPKKWRLW